MRSLLLPLFGVFMLTTTGCATQNVYSPVGETNNVAIIEQEEKKHSVTRLANGLTVLIVEDARFPLVSTRLYIHAGSAYEKPEQAGISHVLEHMVFKGTENRPKGAISEEVESAGGYLNAGTSFDYTVYIMDMPSRHWKLGVDIVRDLAFHAVFDADELASEKKVVLAELQRGKDSPHSQMFENVLAASLKDTPYARPIIGSEETINAITIQDMQAYLKQYYQPQNMLLVVVGNVQAEEVLAEVAETFGEYKNTTPLTEPKLIDPSSLDSGPTIIVKPGPWNKVYFAAAVPVPDMADYQTASLDVLAYLLGNNDTSLFVRTYKYERQLVDSISVMNMNFERVGVFLITAELDVANLQAFWQGLTKDLASLSKVQFSDAELARAKINLEDAFFRSKETLPGFASKVGQFQFFLGGEQGEQNALEALRAVNKRMLKDTMTKWFRPERLSTSILPPLDYTAKNLEAILDTNWPTQISSDANIVNVKADAEIIDLGKGRKLILLPDSTMPYMSLSLLYAGGDALATPDQQGLASLTARMITKGTKGKNAQGLEAYFADRATSVIASAGQQTFVVAATGPTRFQKDIYAGLRDILVNSVFDAQEFTREQKTQVALIRSREDSALGLAFRQLPPFLFPDSVYGYKRLGDEKELMAFKADMTQDFWATQAHMPWVLAVAGDFDKDMLVRFAKSLPSPKHATPVMGEVPWGTDYLLDIVMPNRNQAHLMLLFKTAPDTSPDAAGLNVLQAVLSGMSGLLFKDLRDDKGLGYTVTAFNQHTPEYGYIAFYIGTEPDKVGDGKAGFIANIERLKTTLLPNDELERGKNQLEGDYYRAIQSLGSRASEASGLVLRGKSLDFLKKQLEITRKVTPEDLQALARKYLDMSKAYIIEVSP